MQQSPMYAAAINSPQSELSGAVNASATTIPVVNAAVLPAGPNLATIGTDETAETIRYTGISGNSLTGVTRGFQSAAKSWSAGAKIARYFTAYDHDTFKGNIEALASEVSAVSLLTSPLTPGQNIITPSVASPADLSIGGQSLVNLLGREGNFESIPTNWFKNSTGTALPAGEFAALDTTNKIYGDYAVKMTLDSVYDGVSKPVKLDTSKNYLLAAEFKLGTVTNVFVRHYNGTTIYPGANSTSGFAYMRISSSNVGASTNTIGVFANGVSGQMTYIDGVRLYEISASDYTAIGSMTPAQVAARWPYVDSMQHVNAVYVKNPGRNLLPPFSDWIRHANATVTEPYKLTLNATFGSERTGVAVNVVAGQSYTFSQIENPNPASYYILRDSNSTGTILGGTGASKTTTITAPSSGVLWVSTTNEAPGTFIYTNPMLNPGSAALPFEPQNPSYLYLPNAQAKSNVDGSVADTIYIDENGEPRIIRRYSDELILDGSYSSWALNGDFAGYKLITVAFTDLPQTPVSGSTNLSAIKYNGVPLLSVTGNAAADRTYLGTAGLAITVADADSGWTENLNPNSNAVKALANGWKANGNNGTAYTSWISILDGSAPPTNTIAYVAANKAPGWSGWVRVTYERAPSNGSGGIYPSELLNYEGSLALHDGPNQIEVGAGVIVRESATPSLFFSAYYGLNLAVGNQWSATPNPFSWKPRAERFAVYADDSLDTMWRFGFDAGGYGGVRAAIDVGDYDPETDYTVTYVTTDTYKLGIAPQTASVQYAGNIGTTVSKLVQDQADLATEVSVHKWILTEDGAYIEDLRRDLDAHEADYVRQPGFGTTGGSANTYTLALSPPLTAYVEGVAVAVKIHAANTGSATININGLGAKNILDSKGNAVLSGKLMANGVYSLRYNGTAFILQGEGGDYGTAGAAQVLTGYTIGTDAGIVSGTMPNQGAATLTPSGTGAVPIPAGYHNGSGVVSQVSVPAANVKAGTTIAGVAGTMPDRGATNLTPSGTGTVAIPAGYHNGSGVVAQVSVPAGNVLTGTTIAGVAGTMPNNGAPTITPGTSNQGIGAGYYSGGTVVGDPDLVSGNIKSGANIFGVPGSSTVVDTADANLDPAYLLTGYSGYDDGQLKSGTMPNRGAPTWTPGTSNQGLAAGYYSGGTVIGDPELITSNIRSGVNIFGVIGSLIEGKRSASGSINTGVDGFYDVTGLNFTPSIILAATAPAFSTKEVIMYYNGYNQTFVPVGGSAVNSSFTNITSSGFRINNTPNGYPMNWFAVE